jgi:hypothetical protein
LGVRGTPHSKFRSLLTQPVQASLLQPGDALLDLFHQLCRRLPHDTIRGPGVPDPLFALIPDPVDDLLSLETRSMSGTIVLHDQFQRQTTEIHNGIAQRNQPRRIPGILLQTKRVLAPCAAHLDVVSNHQTTTNPTAPIRKNRMTAKIVS